MVVYVCNECQARFDFRSMLAVHQINLGHEGMTIKLLRDAEAAGLVPLTDEQAEAMRKRLRNVSSAIHGRK